MQKIVPCLWFNDQASEAAKMYIDIFNGAPGSRKKSQIGHASTYDEASAEVSGQKEGSTMTVPFTLDGQEFLGLNGGPMFKFTEAVSFTIDCKDQKEVDYFWDKLIAGGGKPSQCGWLKDKFGLSWQVVPEALVKLMGDPDEEKAGRVMKAMLEMTKIDVAGLEAAYNGK